MDNEFKRAIIMEHYENPINRHIPVDVTKYQKVNTNNESCIDNIDIYVDIENDIIKDITFTGEACAISTSSTSVMIKNLIGKTVKEAKEYVNNFEAMVHEELYDETLLQEGLAYQDIYKQQNRVTCALLPYKGIKKVIDNL